MYDINIYMHILKYYEQSSVFNITDILKYGNMDGKIADVLYFYIPYHIYYVICTLSYAHFIENSEGCLCLGKEVSSKLKRWFFLSKA